MTEPRQHEAEQATRLELAGLGAIVAATVAVHVTAGLGGEFVYDDHDIVERNPLFESEYGWRDAFVADVWAGDPTHAGGTSYYRPVFSVALLAVRTLVGRDPTSFHAASLALHVRAMLLLWAVSREVGFSRGARLVAASVFALHPSTVQAIAWPSAISDPLAACFGFAAILAMARYVRIGTGALLGCVAVAFGLGLGTLERSIAFAVPLALVLATTPETMRRLRGAAAVVTPIIALLLARSVIVGGRLGPPFSGSEVVATWPSVLARYARMLVAPFELAFAYPERLARSPSAFAVFSGAAVLAAIVIATGLGMRARPTTRFAIVSAIATFSPALALGSIPGYALVQDRYVYFSLGFVGLGLGGLIFPIDRPRSLAARSSFAVGLGALVVTWATTIPGLRRTYASDLALYDSAVTNAPDNPHFLMNLSNELRRRAIPQADCALLVRAAQGIERDPARGDPPLIFFNLGNCQRNAGRVDDALRSYDRAIAASGGGFDGPFVNSILLRLDHEDPNGALDLARSAVARAPRSAVRHRLLGFVYARRGELESARTAARRSVQLDPNDAEGRAFLLSLGGG